MIGGPVETFQAELSRHLRRHDEARRRALIEIGDHLRDLVAEGTARGLDELAAETAAVERFGSPRALALSLRPRRRLARRLSVAAAVGFAAAGGLAIATLRTPAPPDPTPPAGERMTFRPADGVGEPVARVIAIDPRTGKVLALPLPPVSRRPRGSAAGIDQQLQLAARLAIKDVLASRGNPPVGLSAVADVQVGDPVTRARLDLHVDHELPLGLRRDEGHGQPGR